jgi:MSHA biogenesis protein MshN
MSLITKTLAKLKTQNDPAVGAQQESLVNIFTKTASRNKDVLKPLAWLVIIILVVAITILVYRPKITKAQQPQTKIVVNAALAAPQPQVVPQTTNVSIAIPQVIATEPTTNQSAVLKPVEPLPQTTGATTPAATQPTMTKVPLPTSPEVNVQAQYDQIQELLAQNQTQTAIERLFLLLGDFPNHVEARELLAKLLIKNGNTTRANELLTTGLKKFPAYAPFAKLKAYIYASNDNTAAAIEILEHNQPEDVAEDPEYFALLAAMYQRQGEYLTAADVYYKLTNVQPDNANWWVGLGTSLEAAGKNRAANEAYQKALDNGQVNPDVHEFLISKVKK